MLLGRDWHAAWRDSKRMFATFQKLKLPIYPARFANYAIGILSEISVDVIGFLKLPMRFASGYKILFLSRYYKYLKGQDALFQARYVVADR